ncbi:MAG: F0F1 ATP synthase subunit B [Lactococcus raffinolactis]|jgi:F-type H+-transporting ATPase subunit b|uniref:ATP synthase subunit b n=1 Tax=Pseudolactococcus raffinolactis TaxID=1366 RepID=A0A2A5SGE1_9LACT|nr:F0F1 ATP synthase subunit B [Lactococcus raffinolactis]MBP6984312.1 F0F1 ATP synthase subunit B [Lactococcus sp.]ATC60640.1 ATP synthase F0 subunit B [Lactococcus raffinolactis]MBR2541830.1 F0F1 ATP synthase subunit B [Lactococcus sp.]MBW9297632.1 ATP synthase F0 subunit B [Lactococcus raffinolactis]MBW9331201.1 ATP synthase F0 subunit B [Lactococcus raffinolactis]
MSPFILLESAPSSMLGNIIVVSGAFLILLVLIKKYAWGAMTSMLDARAKKINDDIDGAENARLQAEQFAAERETELAGSRDEATKIINNAKDTAEANKAKIAAEAAEEARRAKQRANEEIEQSKKEAISGIKGNVADISVKIAEKLIGQTLDASAQSDLIDQYLEKLGE